MPMRFNRLSWPPLSRSCPSLREDASGGNVGARDSAIDVSLGLGDLGSALAGGDLPRIEALLHGSARWTR